MVGSLVVRVFFCELTLLKRSKKNKKTTTKSQLLSRTWCQIPASSMWNLHKLDLIISLIIMLEIIQAFNKDRKQRHIKCYFTPSFNSIAFAITPHSQSVTPTLESTKNSTSQTACVIQTWLSQTTIPYTSPQLHVLAYPNTDEKHLIPITHTPYINTDSHKGTLWSNAQSFSSWFNKPFRCVCAFCLCIVVCW